MCDCGLRAQDPSRTKIKHSGKIREQFIQSHVDTVTYDQSHADAGTLPIRSLPEVDKYIVEVLKLKITNMAVDPVETTCMPTVEEPEDSGVPAVFDEATSSSMIIEAGNELTYEQAVVVEERIPVPESSQVLANTEPTVDNLEL